MGNQGEWGSMQLLNDANYRARPKHRFGADDPPSPVLRQSGNGHR